MSSDRLEHDPEFTIEDVAAFIGRSIRWLRYALAEDAASDQPALQFHGRIGRTLVWTQAEAEALRKAIRERYRAKLAPEKPVPVEKVRPIRGRAPRVHYETAAAAWDRVLNWCETTSGKTGRRSAGRKS